MMDSGRRVSPRLTRAVRVPTPGVRARVNAATGDLLNVSATGALVRLPRELPVGSSWPVILDLDARRIDLSGRVVRCERLTIALPGGGVLERPAYVTAVMFTHASASAVQGVAQLCGGAIAIEELPFRVLVVSDDKRINADVGGSLAGAGYQARLVTDAREALAAAQQCHADAAIVNLRLNREPSMWWVLEVLESDPATAGIPLVALAEPASLKPDRRQYLVERRVRLLPLPVSTDDLLALLARTLRR